MLQSLKNLNFFNTLILKQIFGKTKNIFKKLEHHFLVESTRIKNAGFPCKSTLSEANVKANRMVGKKMTYHKGWSFASNYFISWKFCFSWRTSSKGLIWCSNYSNAHIHTFCERWIFLKWNLLFSNEYLIPQKFIYVINGIKSTDHFTHNVLSVIFE